MADVNVVRYAIAMRTYVQTAWEDTSSVAKKEIIAHA